MKLRIVQRIAGLIAVCVAVMLGLATIHGEREAPTQNTRDLFVGSWRLVSLEHTGPDGKIDKPNCSGQFVFTADGHAAARTREPALGLSADRRRAERPWHCGVGDDGAHLAPSGESGTGGAPPRDDLARVRPSASAEPSGCRLLHGRDHLAATPLHPFLHRARQPPRAPRRVHGESDRAMGRPAGKTTVVDIKRARRADPVSDS